MCSCSPAPYAGHETIGRNEVWVPNRLYKLVYDQATGGARAYELPNSSAARVGRPMNYTRFVRASEWNLLRGLQVSGSVAQ